MPISKRKILKNMREGFAGPEGEPSAGCSVAQRNPQKPDPKGRAQIIQIKKLITKHRTKNNSNKKIAIEIRRV
jgi:hypothetical protein